jgi:predicted naringenin-chalcone synthase
MGRIISIGTAVPQYTTIQKDILRFMHDVYRDEAASRKLKILFQSSGISNRHSVLPDFGGTRGGEMLFLGGKQPQVDVRMEVFREKAVALALEAVQASFRKINAEVDDFPLTHLITVTCTGLFAPGLDAAIMERLDLPRDIFHTAVNFAGCNAAFPALKIADMITKTEENVRVLVVCAELCTLHFQPKNNADNLLSNTIFGDGAAAVLMVSDHYAEKNSLSGLSVGRFYSNLLAEGKNLMGWNIKPLNFEMILNPRIPAFIGAEIESFILRVSAEMKVQRREIGRWAVHPGGRKILDVVKEKLKLTEDEMAPSYQVLEEHGNMSSPTILFILNRILEKPMPSGEKIFAIGFGPGISVDTILFQYAESV